MGNTNLLDAMSDLVPKSDESAIVEHLRSELAKSEPSRQRRIIEKFILAALGRKTLIERVDRWVLTVMGTLSALLPSSLHLRARDADG